MATIRQDLVKLREQLNYVHAQVDKGCELFKEEMPLEAEIAFSEAIQFSEDLLENNPDNSSYLSILTETHHIISFGYTYNDDYDKAFTHMGIALSLYESFKQKDRQYEMTLYSTRARIEVKAKQHDKAINTLEKIICFYDHCCLESFRLGDYVYCSDLLLLANEYFETNHFLKGMETTEKVLQFHKRKNNMFTNQLFNDYLELLHLAAEKADCQNENVFLQRVLEEGISVCTHHNRLKDKSCLCSLATFYQDIIKLMFFRNDKEMLKHYYEELVAHCDRHIHEEPRLRIHKIAGLLNYAVFCSIERNDEEAEEALSKAIGDCMELDDNGLEQTLFLFSALHTMANLKWQNGDKDGALRELERESNILMSYLSRDLGKKPDLFLLFLDLIKNEVILYNDLGFPDRGESVIDTFKENILLISKNNEELGMVPYMAALKKTADIHWILRSYDQARNEYHEVLMIIDDLREGLPEMTDSFMQLENEIRDTLSEE